MLTIRIIKALIKFPIVVLILFIAPLDWKVAKELEEKFNLSIGAWELFIEDKRK